MIFILGGKGFVGSGIVAACEKYDLYYEVITRDNYGRFVGKQCDLFINANGNSKKFLSNKSPIIDFEASVLTVRKSLEDFKFNKYILMSSCDVYSDCSSPDFTREDQQIDGSVQSAYGFHKYLAELCVQHVAKKWIIFRCGGFVGPGLWKNPIYDILNDKKLYMHPDSELQYIHTNDAGSICLQIANNDTIKNEIINLTSRGTIKLQEVIEFAKSSVSIEKLAKKSMYQISTKKLQSYIEVPESRSTVMGFVTEWIQYIRGL